MKVFLFLLLFLGCAGPVQNRKPFPDFGNWFKHWERAESKVELLSLGSQVRLDDWIDLCQNLSGESWEEMEFIDAAITLLARLQNFSGAGNCITSDGLLRGLFSFTLIKNQWRPEHFVAWHEGYESGYAFQSHPRIPVIFMEYENGWVLNLEKSLEVLLRPIEVKAKRHPQGFVSGLLTGIQFLGLHPEPKRLLLP